MKIMMNLYMNLMILLKIDEKEEIDEINLILR